MRPLEPFPQAALELWTSWRMQETRSWPARIVGPEGELLSVFEQAASPALLVEPPLEAHYLGARVAWRVAFDAIVLRITVRGQLAAFLRPIELGEADHLKPADMLRCERRGYRQRRDALLEELLAGHREKVIVRRNNLLLAVLATLPPPGVDSLESAARQEAKILRRLRQSRMRREELFRLLNVWDAQQERRGQVDPPADSPVVRIISQGEDAMLRELRRRSIHTPRQLARHLANDP